MRSGLFDPLVDSSQSRLPSQNLSTSSVVIVRIVWRVGFWTKKNWVSLKFEIGSLNNSSDLKVTLFY